MISTQTPFTPYTDLDGSPIDAGYVYFGVANQNPETSPLTVYWDSSGLIPAAQPVRTLAGFPANNGRPAHIYSATDYSITVKDRYGRLVYYSATSAEYSNDFTLQQSIAAVFTDLADGSNIAKGDALIAFKQSSAAGVLTGATAKTVHTKLQDFVSVKDFGAVGDGVADDTAAFQAALNAVGARPFDGALYIPASKYKITSTLTVPDRVSIFGEGGMASTIQAYSCDGLTFNAPNSEGETFFYEDFSIEGMAGSNYTAINSPIGGGIKYGLHFNRLRLRNMNAGINLANNLHCSITNCSFTKMNQPVALGDVSTFTKITANTMICEGGDDWSSSGAKRGIYVPGGSNCEATKISENFIYGFARAIELGTTTDVQITNNGLDACTEYGIYFQAVQHNFNIKDNFIELLGTSAVAGIYGLPLGSGEYLSQINIEGNSFTELGGATVATIGILMNTTVDTYQWHLRIVGNVFNSMKTHDIKLNLPGQVYVANNRMMSTSPTYSLWIGGTASPPVLVENNWLKKDVWLDVAGDLDTSKVTLRRNAINDTWTAPSGTWVPADASGAGLVLTVTSATYQKEGRLVTCSLDITWPATADATGARISLPYQPIAAFGGALGYSTVGTISTLVMSSVAANFILYDAAGVQRTNAAMSGKRIQASFTYLTNSRL